ncbi:MAG TPA: hypothetical protein VFX05_09320 [Casimicrobiaceae bacterium]|nr:hypothetical protein [Casimicrobiaceae bacterium]
MATSLFRRRRAASVFLVALPAPAWAAIGPVPTWAAYALFVVAAVVVIALLLREALFTNDDEQPVRDHVRPITPQTRYDAGEAASKTAANRRVA